MALQAPVEIGERLVVAPLPNERFSRAEVALRPVRLQAHRK